MTTIAKTHHHDQTNITTMSLSSRYNNLVKKLEFSHFALIALAILVGSCLGSITTMYIFENNAPMWQFIVGLGFTMANLVACISQAPTKWVVGIFSASLIINTFLLILNLV